MFVLGFSLGIFSYIIFFLGVFGLLYAPLIVGVSLLYWVSFITWKKNVILTKWENIKRFGKEFRTKNKALRFVSLTQGIKNSLNIQKLFPMTVLGFLILQICINLIGVLGPEIGFDALWYHLTLPKYFLQLHTIEHIPGGLLYYSDMPKLIEMLYIPGLVFLHETGAKLIHFFFGILCCIALYKVGRKFFSPLLSLIAVAIFYSNLVVGWESISAYIDLARTFFAILSVWGLFNFVQTKKVRWLIMTGVCLGWGIATKFLALIDFGIFIPLFTLLSWGNKKALIYQLTLFILVSLLVPLPWWIYSYIQTNNPFYPFFTSLYPTVSSLNVNPLGFVSILWNTFTHSADPISPMYIAFLPLLFIVKNWTKNTVILVIMGGLCIITWYITPQTGGGRFLLPYLPVFSLLVVLVYQQVKDRYLQKLFKVCLIGSLCISLGYRAIANVKFVPVIIGQQSKAAFLSQHLNFSFGDWYDIDGYMAPHIKPTDTVLLYGYHNLYYINFPYIHESWVKKGDKFDYIATSGGIPTRFKDWTLVYENATTHMQLYNKGGKMWIY